MSDDKKKSNALTEAIINAVHSATMYGDTATVVHEIKLKGYRCPITGEPCWKDKCGPETVTDAKLETGMFHCEASPAGTKLIAAVDKNPKKMDL